jgi:hypothetical protein
MIQDLDGLSRFERAVHCSDGLGVRVRRDYFLDDVSKMPKTGLGTAPRMQMQTACWDWIGATMGKERLFFRPHLSFLARHIGLMDKVTIERECLRPLCKERNTGWYEHEEQSELTAALLLMY